MPGDGSSRHSGAPQLGKDFDGHHQHRSRGRRPGHARFDRYALRGTRGTVMNFRLWASVKAAGPQRLFVTVSAASEHDPDRTGGVETGEAKTLEEAKELRDRLVEQLRARLRARGHEVIDIKLE